MKEKNNAFLLLASVVAALGGLLFGFDTAVISGTTPFIQPYFHLNDVGLGWTVSSLLIGCIVGVTFAGRPGDIFGRRNTLRVAALIFLASAVGSALAAKLWVFITFRFFGGIAVGTASMLSPMYISEISPGARRGALVSLNQLAIVIGILIAFFSNYLLVGVGADNWRWMLSVMGLPALLFFFSLLFVPESPRWLVQKGRTKEAFDVLSRINGEERAHTELRDIEESVAKEEGTYREVFSKELRPLLFIGMLLAIFQQMTGINSIMYYAPIIFKTIGNGTSSALMQTIAVGAVNLTFTLVSLRLIDRWGRKPLLLVGAIGMIVSLFGIAIAFFTHHFAGYLILVLILLFIASFAVSIGPVAWVVIAEIFPNKLRSKAMSVAIVTLWTFTFLVSLTFPIILDRLGGGAAFTMFGVMCVLLLIYVIFKLPETKGKSLEELERVLLKKS
ncbi:MAG: sugar porter family MFS transporter [Bacteroidetes bacterium]|jgi:sugar porter (SP) family MFS transporter|nr:sugar porter family MFS transporter [Bacteroidota bacterium]